MTGLLSWIVAAGTIAGAGSAHDLAGHWRGAVVRLNAVQTIEVNLAETADGVTGTYAIPDLALYDEPLREVSADDSSLTLRILYGPFTLRRHPAHDELTGGNARWNPPLAMHLKRAAVPASAWYTREDVVIAVDDDVSLAATLYAPRGTGPFAAVAVIPGSGGQSRGDWSLRAHAFALVRSGVACLVYDKRGTGASTGSYEYATFPELARDATAAVAALRRRADVVPDAVGLMGISQGGWIAAIAAHRHPAPDFVVFLEGPARSLHEQDIDRVRYQMTADGFSPAAVDSALAFTRLLFDGSWDDVEAAAAGAATSTWAEYVALPESKREWQWWRDAAYDPANDLSALTVPALVILGEHDPAVPPSENRPLFERYLGAAGVPHRIEVIPGLYHAAATFHTLEGGRWDWPDGYWVWSKRPPRLDAALDRWFASTAGSR